MGWTLGVIVLLPRALLHLPATEPRDSKVTQNILRLLLPFRAAKKKVPLSIPKQLDTGDFNASSTLQARYRFKLLPEP